MQVNPDNGDVIGSTLTELELNDSKEVETYESRNL
jgi:hypothetical protein